LYTWFWWKTLQKKTEDPGIDGWLILKWLLQVLDGKAWARFIWVCMNTSSTLEKTVMNLHIP